MSFDIKFTPSGRGKAQCEPDPKYPNGVTVNMCDSLLEKHCTVDLPYPAKECGYFHIRCSECDLSFIVTCAGRADDPKRVRVACKNDKTIDCGMGAGKTNVRQSSL